MFEKLDDINETTFVNKKTGDKIYLKPNQKLSGRNPISDLYLNSTKIGEITDYSVSINQCSPDGRYCIITSESISGPGITRKIVDIIDIQEKKMINLGLLPRDKSIIYENNIPATDKINIIDFIESYKWINNNMLEITAYYIAPDHKRSSPKQIWQYDLSTNKYTLIKTLAD